MIVLEEKLINYVEKYAKEQIQYRRVMLFEYFDEKIDTKKCHGNCDCYTK
jgi:hypothetical protein